MMKLQRISKQWVWLVGGAALVLAGCGGNGGGGGGGGSAASTTPVTITVRYGTIQGATVCLDQNNNGMCDASEDPRKTDAKGQATFDVPSAQVGKYPALVIVDVGAIDAQTGKVSMRYTMKAPKDAVNLVTPLTTLVQSQVEVSGASTSVAADWIQWQLSMRNSPMDDFSSNSDMYAQTIANAVVLATQAQLATIQSAVGQRTASGALATQADIDALAGHKVVSLGYALSLAAVDIKVVGASDANARLAALKQLVDTILASSGIPDQAAALAALNHIQAAKAGGSFQPGTASASLTYLSFDAPNDVSATYAASTAAENTPMDNRVRLRALRYRSYPNGDVATWSAVNGAAYGGGLHWNGSAWKVCGINEQHTFTVPDAQGNSTYNYCDSAELGISNSRTVDIAGQKMIDVYRSIRNQGYFNLRIANAVNVLGNVAVFPAGSKLELRKSITTSSAFVYYPGTGSRVNLPDAALAAGNPTVCTAQIFPATSVDTTLEQLVARLRGTPCIYDTWSANTGLGGATLDTGSRNEYWGSTTLSLGKLGDAPTVQSEEAASAFYTGNTQIRVAFGNGGVTKYYACQESYAGGSSNCSVIGNGSYVIETLGDSRVMRFTNLPQMIKGAQYWERVYVEHAGHVYFGYRDLPTPNASAWLNLPATNALFSELGMGKTVNPGDLLSLTVSSYEGTYSGSIVGKVGGKDIMGTFTLTLKAGQSVSCSGTSTGLMSTSNSSGAFTCSSLVVTPGSTDSTRATISFGLTSSGESFTGTVDYYTGLVSGDWSNGGTAKGTFTGMRE